AAERTFGLPTADGIRPLLRDSDPAAVVAARRARRAARRRRPGGPGRGGGLHALLDGRAPLLGRVLVLLRARGAVRRGGGAHQPDQDWSRRPAAAGGLQSTAPRRRERRDG